MKLGKFIKNNLWKIIGVLFLAAVIFIGAGRFFKPKIGPNQFNPQTQTTVSPQTGELKQQLTLAGSIDASAKTTLAFQTAGKLTYIGVKVGDTVKKYQIIAGLDKTQLQKQLTVDFNNYQTTLSQFQDTQDQYQQLKDTYQLTNADKRILDRSQWNLNNSVTQYELQDIAIRDSSVVSPIAGIVVDMSQLTPGVNVNPANATFTIVDPASIYFTAQIDQEDVSKLKVGQQADIQLDSYPDSNFPSTVTYISFLPLPNLSTTSYEARFKLALNNQDQSYRLGMTGNAVVNTADIPDTLSVPIDAVSQENNQNYVLVKGANNQLIKTPVTTGIETDTQVQILSGLYANDQIVIQK